MKKILHITERKRKSNVHHYCKSDDLRAGFKVAEWGMFCHSERLQITPARFKQVYSDSALHPVHEEGPQHYGAKAGNERTSLLQVG